MLNWLLGKSGSSSADSKKTGGAPPPLGPSTEVRSAGSADKPTLVVVNAPLTRSRLDDGAPELQTLADLPDFRPLLRSSLVPGEHDSVPALDAHAALALAQRYESHLRQCAEAVSFDQNALCVRIKEIDFAIKVLSDRMSDRQKLMSRYAEQMQKAQDLSRSLNKLSMSLQQTVSLMESLNEALPPQERLGRLELGPSAPSRITPAAAAAGGIAPERPTLNAPDRAIANDSAAPAARVSSAN